MQIKQVYAHYDPQASQASGGFVYCPFCRAGLVLTEVGGKFRPRCPGCGFVQFKNPAPTVSILIVDGDRVVLGKRLGEPGRGLWGIPSGYIEYEDDLLAAAIREAREETGLEVALEEISNVISSGLSPEYHFLSLFVVARPVGGELAAGDDLAEVGWFPLTGPRPEMAFQEDVHALDWYAANRGKGLPVDPDYCR